MTTLRFRNLISRSPSRLILFLIPLAVACFALPDRTQAVSPPPDGGYPGGNTAEGQSALLSRTTGGFNTANGFFSLKSNTTGNLNTAIGAGALLANNGDENTAVGAAALLSNITGVANVANGAKALLSNTGGGFNTANGDQALYSNTTGYNNTAIGSSALYGNISGNYNIGLGYESGTNVTTATNVVCLGSIVGANVSNTTWIPNIYGTGTISGMTLPVIVSDAGQLGTTSSSRRFKKDIKSMDDSSEAILALKPVMFHYKSDKANTLQFGLVAEDVAEVDPDLVVRDKEGKPYTVRYDQVNAMLLNEFLKEHRKVEEQNSKIQQQEAIIVQVKSNAAKQEATIGELKSGMQALVATVKEQAAQIQKVSARLEASKPTPQIVNNP